MTFPCHFAPKPCSFFKHEIWRQAFPAVFAAFIAACGGGGNQAPVQASKSDTAQQPVSPQQPAPVSPTPSGVPASAPPPAPAPAAAQTPATLAQTLDVELTREIRSLAQGLNNDPLRIFQYLSEIFFYEPHYFGSLKGAQETLQQQAGNDYDLASLLIAVLRSVGIDARYAQAMVRMPISRAMNWIGVDSPEMAVAILWTAEQVPSAQGYRARLVYEGHRPVALEFPHVWVEARLGQADAPWTALDPSFKTHVVTPGKNLGRLAGLSAQELVSSLLQGSSASADGSVFALPSPDAVDTLLRGRLQKMKSALAVQEPGLTLRQIVGGRQIVHGQSSSHLPDSLPFETIGAVTRFDAIPETERHALRVRFQGIDVLLPLPQVASGRLTISYAAADPANQARLDELGGVLNVPANALELKPQLRLNGTVVAEGYGLSLGSRMFNNMQLFFQRGNSVLDSVVHANVAVGGHYAIALDTSAASREKIQSTAQRLAAAMDAAQASRVFSDEVGGELLHALGLAFFAYQNRLAQYAAGTQEAVIFHQVNEALVSLPVTVDYSRMPFPIASAGIGIDNKRNAFSIAARTGDPSLNVDALRFSILQASSSAEDLVLRLGAGLPATSTVALLRNAAAKQVRLLALDQGNSSQVLPLLHDNPKAEAYIRPAIGEGRSVLVPQDNLQELDWSGLGWIERPLRDSRGGFLMADGLNGAQTTWSLVSLPAAAQAQVLREAAQVAVDFLRKDLLGALDDAAYDTPVAQLDAAAARYVAGLLVYGDVLDAILAAHQCDQSTRQSCETVVLAALASVPAFADLRAASGFVPSFGRLGPATQPAVAPP